MGWLWGERCGCWADVKARGHADDPDRQAGLGAIVDVPLEAAELCQSTAIEAQPLLEGGYPPALPDGQVGIQLLEACQRALCILIRAHLPALVDATPIDVV